MRFLLFSIAIAFLGSCNKAPERNFEFDYKVSLKADTIKNTKIWIPIPASNAAQEINNLNIQSNIDYEIKKEEKFGNTYYFTNIKGERTKASHIHFHFTVHRKQRNTIAASGKDVTKYLLANRLVPVGGRFDSIIKTNSFRPDNMRAIYDFVQSEMQYGKPKTKDQKDHYYASLPEIIKKNITKDSVVNLYERSKLLHSEFTFGNGNSNYACDISVGNCTDFHSYFMSLARSMKVPARFHIGFSIPTEKKGKIGGYHCWADYYSKDQWIPIDISEADKSPEKSDFYFGNLDFNRVEFTHGRDLKLEDYHHGLVNFFIYPIVEEDGVVTNNYSKTFSYREIN
ncbi:transglutaminase domain-containing protein [Ancylomarina longa]|uniref:Transglutaminase-like domain-containing protein n=1 Tax=Ancylomarina longa TaxID=2487017 RepID=A0A434AXC6_9BACT|nr:transglutaminase domain-containing protein [Ancylomarina longa]RUT79184.1 hypothetical protein DLK05_05035 [Ancylomarina longa]